MSAIQQRINRLLPTASNLIIDSTGGRHLVYSSMPSSPDRVVLLDEKSGHLSLIAHLYPDLKSRTFTPARKIVFAARDGTTLEAYLTMPPGSNETDHPRPLILFPHGGPGARDYGEFNLWTQFFANHGWAVLQVNFRGSAGYGESFLRAGFHRWGLEMQDDLTDGVRWLTAQGIADPQRVCIVGASYGGYAALMGIVKTPELYRCA